MKKLILSALVALTVCPLQAQLFGPESLTGAALGGIAGGVIGHNNGRKTAEGAAIGAGAGLVLGALVGHERRERETYSPAPTYYGGEPSRPNYAVAGAVVGGVAGGVIGHNNGRNTAEGIAIGAGAGLLLGGVAEMDARRREREVSLTPAPVYYAPRSYVAVRPYGYSHHSHYHGYYGPRYGYYSSRPTYWAAPVVVAPAPIVVVAPAPAPAPQATPIIINNYYNSTPATPMSGANSMFGR